MQQAGYQHANVLAQELSRQIQQQLAQRDEQLLSVIQSIPSLAETSSSSDSDDTPPSQIANSVITQNTQLEILKLLQDIRQDMIKGNQQQKREPRKGPFKKTPDDQTQPKRRNTSYYCWTCGKSNHPSKKCKFKAPGHQDLATFENKMGGSKAYCS